MMNKLRNARGIDVLLGFIIIMWGVLRLFMGEGQAYRSFWQVAGSSCFVLMGIGFILLGIFKKRS
jgi:hypothetical protein